MVSMAKPSGGVRRRTSREETFCSACSPGGPGATIPGTGRRPGQTVGRARGLSVSTACDPTPASDTIDYHNSTPFSSYRVPHKRHKWLLVNSNQVIEWTWDRIEAYIDSLP